MYQGLETFGTLEMELFQNRNLAIFTVVALIFVFCQFSYIPDIFALFSKYVQTTEAGASDSRSAEPHENPARQLINDIKEATRRASGSSNGPGDMTTRETDAWNRENPCLSRQELITMYDKRKHTKKLPANPLWDEVFTEYSKLHRTCIRKAGNLSEYFLTGNVSTGCQFLIADVGPAGGIGNRYTAMASCVLYAIVTKRVILVIPKTLIPDAMCEPFLGSSWVLDVDTFPVAHFLEEIDLKNTPWTFEEEFFARVDERMTHLLNSEDAPWGPVNAVMDSDLYDQHEGRFYCSAEQAFYSEVTWVYFSSYYFTVPRLFSAPPFQATLEALFPDKMVTTRILRSVFLPSELVWDRVRSLHRAHLEGGDRTVGIQLRYTYGIDQFTEFNDFVNYRIFDCTQRNQILPNITEVRHRKHPDQSNTHQKYSDSKTPPNPVVKVFIASLFPGLMEHLSKVFGNGLFEAGEDVDLVQISKHKDQKFDNLQEDVQAFAEILLLSLSDQLIVTGFSTFGGLALAYGALTPWFVTVPHKYYNEDPNRQAQSCVKSSTTELCNIGPDTVSRCLYGDLGAYLKPIPDLVPYVKECVEQPETRGIQLITDFQN